MRVPSSYTLRKSRGLRMRELFGNARFSEELRWLCRGWLGDSFCVADDPFVANGELPAAAFAAAGQYGAAIHCLHAGAEAVLFGALTVIRLKSSLRHISESAPFRRRFPVTTITWKTGRALLPGQIVTYSAKYSSMSRGASIESQQSRIGPHGRSRTLNCAGFRAGRNPADSNRTR